MRSLRRAGRKERAYRTISEILGEEVPVKAPEPPKVEPAPVAAHIEPVAAKLPTETPLAAAPLPTVALSGQPQAKRVAAHKRDRHLPNRKHVSFRLDKEKAKQYKRFAEDADMELGVFYDLAAAHFIKCVGSHLLANVGSERAHDDLMIWQTVDDVIIMYRNYTGNRWKPADDEAGKRFNGADRRLLEIGILNTLLNAKGKKINSFAYFIPEIEEAMTVKLSDETIEIMLPRRRAQWAGMKRGK